MLLKIFRTMYLPEETRAGSSGPCLRKNERALKFYLREGFHVKDEQIDENTGESQLLMIWEA